MKKIYLFNVFLIISVAFSQDKNLGKIEDIANHEMQSASKTMQLAVNANTSNYNITYQKLEFNVDPAVYSVAGKISTTFTALSNMTSITFDMANQLTASLVKVDGVVVTGFSNSGNNELVIPLSCATGVSKIVEVTYSGVPPLKR